MDVTPKNVGQLAKAKERENAQFRSFIKFHPSLSDEQIDQLVFDITRRVWAYVDCTKCANCCKELRPGVTDEEIDRLAKRLGISPMEFVKQYLTPDSDAEPDDPPMRIRAEPCPFLVDNKCSVYDDRPEQCREYPYLYKPDFTHRTMDMVGRTFDCPIVFEVMEELKKATGFRPKRRP